MRHMDARGISIGFLSGDPKGGKDVNIFLNADCILLIGRNGSNRTEHDVQRDCRENVAKVCKWPTNILFLERAASRKGEDWRLSGGE